MTKLSETDRSQVCNELAEATGPMTAEVMMRQVIDAPWHDLVTKRDLDTRFGTNSSRLDTLDAKIDTVAARLDAKIDTVAARSDARLERSLRRQTIWMMSAMFTFNGLLAAWLTTAH